jgi:hypothetical protein
VRGQFVSGSGMGERDGWWELARSGSAGYGEAMSTLAEIEQAIEALPPKEVDELVAWLDNRKQRSANELPFERWLERARGAATTGMTTDAILVETRGEE